MSLVCLLVTTVLIQRQTYLEIQSANAKDASTQVSFRQEETSQIKQKIRSLENVRASDFAINKSGFLQTNKFSKNWRAIFPRQI